jgi:serine/threonine protein kinase
MVYHKVTGDSFALKVYERYKLTDPMKKKAVQREIAVLKKINHPNVIKLIELIETPKQLNLVTEYVNGISLHTYCKNVNSHRRINDLQCRKLFKQIAEGIEYLH